MLDPRHGWQKNREVFFGCRSLFTETEECTLLVEIAIRSAKITVSTIFNVGKRLPPAYTGIHNPHYILKNTLINSRSSFLNNHELREKCWRNELRSRLKNIPKSYPLPISKKRENVPFAENLTVAYHSYASFAGKNFAVHIVYLKYISARASIVLRLFQCGHLPSLN